MKRQSQLHHQPERIILAEFLQSLLYLKIRKWSHLARRLSDVVRLHLLFQNRAKLGKDAVLVKVDHLLSLRIIKNIVLGYIFSS